MTAAARTLTVILARAGSKGLPGKNTRDIAGRPCIAWTIDHAQGSRSAGRIVVSTDDPLAASIARSMGVEVIDRPPALADDGATVDAAARHALDAAQDPALARIALLYANVPLRPDDLTDRALDLLDFTGCDSVQSYAPVGKHHPWWTARLDNDACATPWEGRTLNNGVFRRQDLPPAYIPDGGVLVTTRQALSLDIPGVPPGPHAFLGSDRRGVITDHGEVIDIDTETDAALAEIVLSRRVRTPTRRRVPA